jgi:hypothetical protein
VVIESVGGVLERMSAPTERETSQVEVAMPIQILGLGLLVLFAGTFGGRWAIGTAGVVLLFLGFVLSGATISVRMPAGPDRAPADGRS